MSGHSHLGNFNNLERPPFFPGYKQILRQLLVQRNQAVWE